MDNVLFLMPIIGLCFLVLLSTFFIKNILKRKLVKEIKLAKIIHLELTDELFSDNWKQLEKNANSDIELKLKMKEKGLFDKFSELSELLTVSKVLITSFEESHQNGVELKEANTTLAFINSVIDSNDEDVTEFNEEVSKLLGKEYREVEHTKKFVEEPMPEMVKVEEENQVENQKLEENHKMETNEENEMREENYSIFTKGLVINGNISVETPLLVMGQINGDVESQNTVELDKGAVISGNLQATEVTLKDGRIIGDVRVSGEVYIGEDTYIKGSVYADSLVIKGFVEGNIHANAEIKFASSAKILGDINAALIDIEKGAKVSGNFNVGEEASTTPVKETIEPVVEKTVEAE